MNCYLNANRSSPHCLQSNLQLTSWLAVYIKKHLCDIQYKINSKYAMMVRNNNIHTLEILSTKAKWTSTLSDALSQILSQLGQVTSWILPYKIDIFFFYNFFPGAYNYWFPVNLINIGALLQRGIYHSHFKFMTTPMRESAC